MKEAHKFFKGYKEGVVGELHTACYAKIIKRDLKYMRADVQPLYAPNVAIVLNVPLGTHQTNEMVIRPPYKVGDIVLCIFSMRDIDPIVWDGGDYSKRTLSLDDAILIGGLTKFTEPLPDKFDEHLDDFIIASRDFNSHFIMTEENEFIIDVPEGKKIYFAGKPKEGVPEQGVPLGDDLKYWLDNHTHGTDGRPTTPSPLPSKKVKVQ